jgi:hypothetical protein
VFYDDIKYSLAVLAFVEDDRRLMPTDRTDRLGPHSPYQWEAIELRQMQRGASVAKERRFTHYLSKVFNGL